MKHFNKLVFLCLVLLFTFNLNAQDNPSIVVEKINDHFYKFTTNTTFAVNSVVFVGDDGILLVDTGQQGASELILEKIRELSDKEIKYIINTHHHADHFSGNELLGKNAIKIAHINYKTVLTTGMNILQEYSSDVLPQLTFDSEIDLHFNNEEIKLIAVPGTHSNSDIIVYFPESKIVCLSAVVTLGNFPFVGPEAGCSIKNYPIVLDRLLSMFNDDVTFVLGHGQNCTLKDIRDLKNMIIETSKIVGDELANGRTIEELQKNDILKDWDSWGQGFIGKNRWIQFIANGVNPPAPQNNNESIAIPMFYTMKEKGIDAAIEQYYQLKKEKPDTYDFREFNLNLFGYSLVGKEKYEDAFKIFKLNIKMFPESANVYDSLGEAYERSGNNKLAYENYKKAVQNGEKINDANLNVYKTNMDRVKE